MAAESDNIGGLSVDVTADTDPALKSLEELEGRLETLSKKETALKIGLGNFEAVASLITQTEEKLIGIGKGGELPPINIQGKFSLKIDEKSVAGAVQKALNEATFKASVNVTIGNLDEIKAQLSGLSIPVNLVAGDINLSQAGVTLSGGGGGGGGGGTGGGASNEARQRLAAMTSEEADRIGSIYNRLNKHLSAAGAPLESATDALGQFLAVTKKFGADLVDSAGIDAAGTRKARAEALDRGPLGRTALQGMGFSPQEAGMVTAIANDLLKSLKIPPGSSFSLKSLIDDAISGGGGGRVGGGTPIVINLGGGAVGSAGAGARTEKPPVSADADVQAVMEKFRASSQAIMARKAEARTSAFSTVYPVNLSEEVGRLLADQRSVSAVSTRPTSNRGATATPAAANANDIARKEAFLKAQEDKLALELANPPTPDMAVPSKGLPVLMEEWERGISGLRASISQTQSRIESLKRATPTRQPGYRAGTGASAPAGSMTDTEKAGAESEQAYVSDLKYGTLREGDVDLTELLRLANRGMPKNYGYMKAKRKEAVPVLSKGKPVLIQNERGETVTKTAIKDVPYEQLIELTNEQDIALGSGRGFKPIEGRSIRRAEPLEVLLDAIGATAGPEGRALAERSLEEEGDKSPVRRALRGTLAFPAATTTGRWGEEGAGRPSASKPTAATEEEDRLFFEELREMKRSNPRMAQAVGMFMRQDAELQRGRIAGEVSDKRLNEMFRAKGKSPLAKLDEAIVQHVGIVTGQLLDPNILIGALDAAATSDRPARNTLTYSRVQTGEIDPKTGAPRLDSKGKPFTEAVATGFKPGSIMTEIQRMVGSILLNPELLKINPDNAKLDPATMSVKQMAAALRATKASVVSSYTDEEGVQRERSIPTNYGFLGDIISALPGIAYESALVAGESSRENVFRGVGADGLSDNARGRGLISGVTAKDRVINTPGQKAYARERRSQVALQAEETQAIEDARNAEIERTAGRLAIPVQRLQPGDREPVGTVGKPDYSSTLRSIRGRSRGVARGINARLAAAEEAVRADYATRRKDTAVRTTPIPAGISYAGEQGEAGRNLVAPETEAALGFIAAQSGASFGIRLPTLPPRVGGRKAESAAAIARSRQFLEPVIQKPFVPEGAPTGKSLLESPAFSALPKEVQGEVRALIEIKGDKGEVTGYRGIGQIGMPTTKPDRGITTGDEHQRVFAEAYPGAVPGSRNVNVASPKDIVAQIMADINGVPRATAAGTPGFEDTLGRGDDRAVPPRGPLREPLMGDEGRGFSGTINVNVLNWPAALLAGAVGAAAGGGGKPPAPPADEPEEEPAAPQPVTNRTGTLRKTGRGIGVAPAPMLMHRTIGVAHSPQERAITAEEQERAAYVKRQEREYGQLFDQLDERDDFVHTRTGYYGPSDDAPARVRTRNKRAAMQRSKIRQKPRVVHSAEERAVIKANDDYRRDYEQQQRAAERDQQNMYEGLFDEADERDDYVRTRGGYYGPRAQSPAAIRRRDQQNLSTRNAEIRGKYQDMADDELGPVRSALRVANRSVPKRGFGASLTDLVTARVGGAGFEKQLEMLGKAEREAADIQTLSRQQKNLQADREVLQAEAALPSTTPQRREAIATRVGEIDTEMGHLSPAIQTATRRFHEYSKEVTRGSTVMKSFGAAAAGAVVSTGIGAITTGLGMAIVAPMMTAVSEGLAMAIGPSLERLLGSPTVTAQFVGQAGQIAGATQGNRALAEATMAQSLNLTQEQSGLISPLILDQGEIEEGNKRLASVGGALRAFRRINDQGVGGVYQGTSGLAGTFINQTPAASQIVGSIARDFVDSTYAPSEFMPAGTVSDFVPEDMAYRSAELLPNAATYDPDTGMPYVNPSKGVEIYKPSEQVADPRYKSYLKELDYTTRALGVLNLGLERGGDATSEFTNEVAKLDKDALKIQEDILRSRGAVEAADAVRDRKVALVDKTTGAVLTDESRISTAYAAEAKGFLKPDLATLMGLNRTQILNQFWQEDTRGQMARGEGAYTGRGIIESQFGIEMAASPIGSATSGIPKGSRGGMRDIKQDYREINALAKEGITQAKAFVAGAGQEVGAGLDPAVVEDFNAALDETVRIGQQISNIQIGREEVHAEYAVKQYNFQLYQTNRSLRDARDLRKAAFGGGGGNTLGGIQGQQWALQRESQSLSLGMSQKQINFQTATAGLTVPGETPEMRAARIQQRKLEAEYAQKQLDIQKKLFGLEGKGFKITVDRSVFDLTRQIGLLTEGRAITIDDAKAQKKLRGLNVLMAREMKTVNNIFDQAQTRANDMLDLTAKFANELAKDAAAVFEQLLRYYKRYYANLPTGGSGSSSVGGGTGLGPQAQGYLGDISGATSMIVGEAGKETVAILRNPRHVSGNGTPAGGSSTITINFNNATVRRDEDLRTIAREVERILGQRASLLYGRNF